jgi:hypothetical protein
MRVLSDGMKNPEVQRMMLKLANDYDKLADRTPINSGRRWLRDRIAAPAYTAIEERK